jgi:N-acetylneuraminic acid mutarotase
VWTGRQLIVVGHRPFSAVAVGESYDPSAKTWKQLSPPAKLGSDPYCCTAVWSGHEVLVFGAFVGAAYNPATNTWHTLSRSVQGGILAWTGKEAIGWGGGCCGDARANGRAYNPGTGVFRAVARSPLAPDERPVGAWNGRELMLFVSGSSPDGKPYPSSFAHGAGYNPATNRWRPLPAMPGRGGKAVWDGHELLVVGGGSNTRAALAFDPATNRWRRLASLPLSASGASAVWTGKRLLVWASSRGVSFDPTTNRWSLLPRWPLRARSGPAVAWTGRSLLVWGGEIGTPVGTSTPPRFPLDGAVFTPEVK